MSQQVNLILLALRPRFDWLALPIVVGAAVAGLLLLGVMAVFGAMQARSLKAGEAEIKGQVLAAQQQIQSLGQTLGARQGDPALDGLIAAARQAVTQRQEVLSLIAQGDVAHGNAYSGLLQGFSRQVVDGVWLTGFGFAEKNIEIHGRLTDPSILPAYINKLNDEPAFAGRRFAALDMTGIEPGDERRPEAPAVATPRAPVRYTEFALRTELLATQEKAR